MRNLLSVTGLRAHVPPGVDRSGRFFRRWFPRVPRGVNHRSLPSHTGGGTFGERDRCTEQRLPHDSDHTGLFARVVIYGIEIDRACRGVRGRSRRMGAGCMKMGSRSHADERSHVVQGCVFGEKLPSRRENCTCKLSENGYHNSKLQV